MSKNGRFLLSGSQINLGDISPVPALLENHDITTYFFNILIPSVHLKFPIGMA